MWKVCFLSFAEFYLIELFNSYPQTNRHRSNVAKVPTCQHTNERKRCSLSSLLFICILTDWNLCNSWTLSIFLWVFTNLFLIFVRYDTSCNFWETLPDMPQKLSDCIPIEVGGALYIVGGQTEDWKTSNIVYCMDDPETGRRLRQKTHLTGSINSIMLAKLNLTLYVSVSLSHRVNYTHLHAYDTSTDVWTMVSIFDACVWFRILLVWLFHIITKFQIGEIPWRTELISSIDYCGQIYILYFDAYGKNSLFSVLSREVSSIGTSKEVLLTHTVGVPFLSPTARPSVVCFVHWIPN